MERDEFLKSLGIGLALVCTGSCFTACSKGGDSEEATPNNGTGNTASIDITSLANIGSKSKVNGVLFIRIAASNTLNSFLATEPACPHEGQEQLNWVQSENKIRCSAHGSEFSSTGSLLVGPATRALKIYNTTLTGTTLTATKS